MDRTDEMLVEKARAGDRLAEEELLVRYKDMVRSKAHLYFIQGADSEDVVQEGMIGICKAIGSYDKSKGCSFRTFADLCISRRIITAVKSADRKKYEPLNSSVSLDKPAGGDDDSVTFGETLASGIDSDPEASYLFREMVQIIMSSETGFLSDFERRVLLLIMEDHDYRSIADILGKPPKSIDNTIQRIKNKLKKL